MLLSSVMFSSQCSVVDRSSVSLSHSGWNKLCAHISEFVKSSLGRRTCGTHTANCHSRSREKSCEDKTIHNSRYHEVTGIMFTLIANVSLKCLFKCEQCFSWFRRGSLSLQESFSVVPSLPETFIKSSLFVVILLVTV